MQLICNTYAKKDGTITTPSTKKALEEHGFICDLVCPYDVGVGLGRFILPIGDFESTTTYLKDYDNNELLFVIENSEEEDNNCFNSDTKYYPDAVKTEEQVLRFNELYTSCYQLMFFVNVLEDLDKRSTAYQTMAMEDGCGFYMEEPLEDSKKQFEKLKKELFDEYGYEF